MTANEIIRSWKDEDYQWSYQGEGKAIMPSNPAGLIELTDEDLLGVDGGVTTLPCGRVASALVGASAGGILSLAVTVAAITIYTALSS